MTFYLAGIAPEECTFDLDTNPSGLQYAFEHGLEYIKTAQRLWDLAGSDRGGRIQAVIDEVFTDADAPEHRLSAEQIRWLHELLTGVEDELGRRVTDENLTIRADQVDDVFRHAPDLVYRTTGPGGATLHSLANSYALVHAVRAYLQSAVERGLEVIID